MPRKGGFDFFFLNMSLQVLKHVIESEEIQVNLMKKTKCSLSFTNSEVVTVSVLVYLYSHLLVFFLFMPI